MSRAIAAAFATALVAAVVPTAASAGCYGCYTPQPCCHQQQYHLYVAPPQYRTVLETVMVSPGRVVTHRTPAQYRTVMVPKTVMVAPEGVAYERLAPQYATQERVEMVAPAPHLLRARRAALQHLRLLRHRSATIPWAHRAGRRCARELTLTPMQILALKAATMRPFSLRASLSFCRELSWRFSSPSSEPCAWRDGRRRPSTNARRRRRQPSIWRA
jgi:hypothetical protein